jgi:hypothetical protein
MAGKAQSAPGVPSNGGIPMQVTMPSAKPSSAQPVVVPAKVNLPSGPTGAVTTPVVLPSSAQVSALVEQSVQQATE